MKVLGKILLVIVILLVLGYVFRNTLIKSAVLTGTKAVVGLDLHIDKLNLDINKSLIDISGIKLDNPKGFVDPVMVDIPKVYVDINAADAMKGKVHVENLELDLKEFMVVKNEKGEVNLDKLKTVAQSKEKKAKKEEKPGKAPEVSVDNLHLKIGKVVFKDYSKGDDPSVKEFVLNLDESHQNIQNLNAVVGLIVMKVVTKTTIGQLTNIDLGSLENVIGGTLKASTGMATKAINDTTKTIKDTTEELQKVIQLPFGNK